MNARLRSIFECIDPASYGVADVGTDHGILPVALALNGFRGNILASDIHEGPLQHAFNAAKDADVSDRIRFYLCDGLIEEFAAQIDTIIIAGMGGDLICSIIDRADLLLDPRYSLILQPMTKSEILRYYLTNNGFQISREIHVSERTHVYSVLCASFIDRNSSYKTIDLYTGNPADYTDPELYLSRLMKLQKEIQKKLLSRDKKSTPETEFYRELETQIIEAQNRMTGRNYGCKE